jgi:hypothetical protein
MTVLISPLSWGFGHAGRMIPLALELKHRGCRVIFAADARLLQIAVRDLNGVIMVEIPGLRISYSRFLPQYLCIALQLPRIVASAIREHRILRRLAEEFTPSVIISDNRFGFYHNEIFSAYITHQILIPFPVTLRFMEPLASWIHRTIISRYDLCLIPDYPGSDNLSGRLSHGRRIPGNVLYMGPLSRFASSGGQEDAGSGLRPVICLILSGPEPQRSLFLEKVTSALRPVLLQEDDGSPERAFTEAAESTGEVFQKAAGSTVGAFPEAAAGVHHMMRLVILSATPATLPLQEFHPPASFITEPDTAMMRRTIASSSLVITRAGYTSVMELVSLGRGAVLVPTPGQTEQEYLGEYLNGRYGFITLRQNNLEMLSLIAAEHAHHPPAELHGRNELAADSATCSPITAGDENNFAAALFEKAMTLLLEQKQE